MLVSTPELITDGTNIRCTYGWDIVPVSILFSEMHLGTQVESSFCHCGQTYESSYKQQMQKFITNY